MLEGRLAGRPAEKSKISHRRVLRVAIQGFTLISALRFAQQHGECSFGADSSN